jgi:hypothetical protein
MKKHIILFFLLMNTVLAYSQTNTIQILNFSSQNIQFKLIGADVSEYDLDCQPVIQMTGFTALPIGQSVIYSQYNTSHLVTPPIYTWHVIADSVGGGDYVANPSLGTTIPAVTSDVTEWRAIQISVNGGTTFFDIGRHCGGVGGIFTSPAGSPVTATWNTLANGNVVIFVN